ncbi:MAG: MFS transporter [Saprospiraceae bacterium]|nr:MFS transporter [Saprospiraceae bacterium]
MGSGAGALFARLQTPLSIHLVMVAMGCLAAITWAYGRLVTPEPAPAENKEERGFRLPVRAIIPLGIIAFCCMTGEGAMADWSAIFMNKVVGASEFFSALAVGAFSAAMTTGRIFGDYLTVRLGKHKLLMYSGLLAFLGLAIPLALPTASTSLVGFFMVGLGLATVVPIVYSSAGNTPGVAPSVGISMATTIGYAGFFVGPPAIGFLADAYGLQIGLSFVMLLFLVMLLIPVVWPEGRAVS